MERMRFFFLFAFFTVVIFAGFVAQKSYRFTDSSESQKAAVFTNDSNVVEVDPADISGEPSNTTADDAEDTNPPPNDVGVITVFPDDNTQPNDDVIVLNNPTVTPDSDTSPVITTVEISSFTGISDLNESVAGETTDETAGNTIRASGGTSTINAREVYATLLGNQAVVASGGGFSGSANNKIRIDAEKLRDSFYARDIYRISIPNSTSLLENTRHGAFSKEDFTLFVSVALLNDENLNDIDFEDGILNMRYRALGRLFGFVPLNYPLRVSVEINAGSIQIVRVKFPWYKFFLATGVSRPSLERKLLAEINTRVLEQSTDLDVATRVFTSVADTLREQFNFSS